MAPRPHAESDADAIRAVARKLVELDRKDTTDLVAMYEERHGEKPRSWHRSHLLNALAYDVQEEQFGGLSRRARRRIRELRGHAPPAWRERVARAGMSGGSAAIQAPRTQPSNVAAPSPPSVPGAAEQRTAAPRVGRDPRLPPPGTIITRIYKRREHRVLVGDDFFEYDGHVFATLTAAAKHIAGGTQVNGFYFFRLGGDGPVRSSGESST